HTRGEGTASPVVLSSAGVHLKGIDIKQGERIEWRRIIVTVRFPDGAPMTSAMVRCIGAPTARDPLPWNTSSVALRNGIVELHAPADRSLTIEVLDWYGRALKATYKSTHEAGTAPISQEFVVQP